MEQATMNEAELTLLSLLSESPRYGHELQTLIEERGLREWITIGFSSIFYLLNKLEKHRLIAAEIRTDSSGMPRKRYALTEAGSGVLQTAVSDLLRQPHALGSGFELGLANLHILKPAQVYRVLKHHRSDLHHRYTTIEQSYQRAADASGGTVTQTDPISALYTHSLAVMGAELTWLDNFLREWVQRHPGSDKTADKLADKSGAVPADTATAEAAASAHSAATVSIRRTTPHAAKRLQKIRRPKDPS